MLVKNIYRIIPTQVAMCKGTITFEARMLKELCKLTPKLREKVDSKSEIK